MTIKLSRTDAGLAFWYTLWSLVGFAIAAAIFFGLTIHNGLPVGGTP